MQLVYRLLNHVVGETPLRRFPVRGVLLTDESLKVVIGMYDRIQRSIVRVEDPQTKQGFDFATSQLISARRIPC